LESGKRKEKKEVETEKKEAAPFLFHAVDLPLCVKVEANLPVFVSVKHVFVFCLVVAQPRDHNEENGPDFSSSPRFVSSVQDVKHVRDASRQE
jgi:hypothetical protein